MFYKLYRYELERDEVTLPRDRHLAVFRQARGPDSRGGFAVYRGQANAVLMHVRRYGEMFAGLVGKHSTERDVRAYDASSDTSEVRRIGDDDYPGAAFICSPPRGLIACVDGSPINARAAIARLHVILLHRANAFFSVTPIREAGDLKFATSQFKVVQIDYQIFPVNPHTGDLGRQLDDSRKQDHVQKMAGKLVASQADPIKLNGGIATQVQELQASGHSSVGYTALTSDQIEIKVPKPREPYAVEDDDSNERLPEVRIRVPETIEYPFRREHIEEIEEIMTKFARSRRSRA
jgi:hypothetical protein